MVRGFGAGPPPPAAAPATGAAGGEGLRRARAFIIACTGRGFIACSDRRGVRTGDVCRDRALSALPSWGHAVP